MFWIISTPVHLFKHNGFLLVTTATLSLNRAEGLLVNRNLSRGAGNPTELFPTRRCHPSSLGTWNIFLWLCCGVWRERRERFLQWQVQRACLQVQLEWHWWVFVMFHIHKFGSHLKSLRSERYLTAGATHGKWFLCLQLNSSWPAKE